MIIFPAIDIRGGKCVRLLKGDFAKETVFSDKPEEMAKKWQAQGAEFLHLVDLDGALAGKPQNLATVKKILTAVDIPVELGGGIRTVEDMRRMLKAGADKTSLNTAAVKNPGLLKGGAEKFGRQCMVLAVDARRAGDHRWEVYVNGGRTPTGLDCLEWVKKAVALGAGEILLTSMDADGTKDGYDIELTRAVSDAVNVPVIASGGAGKLEHFYDVLTLGHADAVLAASVFHYGQFTVRQVKEYLQSRGVEVRF